MLVGSRRSIQPNNGAAMKVAASFFLLSTFDSQECRKLLLNLRHGDQEEWRVPLPHFFEAVTLLGLEIDGLSIELPSSSLWQSGNFDNRKTVETPL